MYDAMLPDYLTALNGVTPPIPPSQVPQNQALVGAISGQPQAPESQRLWGAMTPEQGRAEVSAALPGYQQAVEAKQGQLSEARARPDEAPALSFMGMPVVSATEARESAERQLQEAQAKKAHAEAQLAGEAALPTTTPLRNAAETAFQSAGTSYASIPKFAGYIGGWLANEAGSGVEPTDNAVFRLGDQADKWAKSTFPGDPARAEEFGTKAAHLTGFLASLYGAGGVKAMTEGGPALAAKIGDAVSKASQAALVTSGGAMTQFEPATAAMEAGKEQHPMAGVTITPQGLPVSERDRAMATLLGAGVGLTSLIPMASTMATAGEREAGAILARALEGSGVNAAQMAAFNVLNNAIAREYYDPNRSLTQGLESDVGLGALAGGATHAFAAATGPKRLSTPEEVKAFIDAAQRSDPGPAKAAYWRGMREMADEKLARLPPPGEPGAGPEAPPVNLAEAGPYALRGRPDWREEAHARGTLREGEEAGAVGSAGEEVGGPGEGAVLPREEREAPATRPVVGTESFDLKDKNGAPLAGFVTNLPSSEKYKAALHFTVYPEGSSVRPFESPKKKLGEPMADVKMRQHHDGTWDIGIMETKPQHERRGIMSSVLNAIEQRVGQKLGGSGLFWEPGYNLWSKRDPEAVKYHQLVEGEGYLSPAEINRQLEANRKSIDELDPIKDWEHIQDLQKDNRTLQRHLDAVPPEGKTPEKLASPLALRGVHGTNADISKIEKSRFGESDPGYYGEGFYMYPYEYAKDISGDRGTFYGIPKEGAKNYLINVDTKNPFYIEGGHEDYSTTPIAEWDKLKPHGWEHENVPYSVWNDYEAIDRAIEEAPQELKDRAAKAEEDLQKAHDDLYSLYGPKGRPKPDSTPEAIQQATARFKEAQTADTAARRAMNPERLLSQKFTKALLDAGYDSVIVTKEGKPYEMVGIKPGTLSTTFGDEPMYALRGFYNPATRVVEEAKQGSMPADQWLKMLQGAGQKGVQKRHLDELGVPEFLSGKGKVAKDELLEHMRINEAPLEEVIHGEKPPHDPAAESRIEALESIMNDRALTPAERHEYRELMDKTSFSPTKFEKYSPFELGENPKEFVIRDPRFKGQYDEPHYRGPVALHVRTWDLNGPNGERILGVGEVQSTLHQRARQEGYDVRFTKEDEDRLRDLGPIRDRLENEYNAIPNHDQLSIAERDELYRPLRDVYHEIDRLDELRSREPIPKAALSDSWLDVGMKRALQYAAENGYDGVTWAKSEQIAPAVGANPEALAADYDKKIPSFFQKVAKKYGAESGNISTRRQVRGSNIDNFGLSEDAVVNMMESDYDINNAISLARDEVGNVHRIGTPEDIRHAEGVLSELEEFAKELNKGVSNTFIRINDKMRADIVEKGLPMARTPERALRMMDDALGSGRTVAVSKAAQGEVHDAIAPVRHVIPEDVGVHALARIEPREDGGLTATFRDVSGADIRLRADSLSDIANLRGFCLNDGANVCITNFFAGGGAAKGGPSGPGEVRAPDAHGGVFMHEAVHSLLRRGLIPADDWARLVNHANSLRVLDMPMHEYLGAIGEDVKPGPDTLRDNYKIAYQNYKKSEVEALLNEEEPVAHMMELFHHGHFKGDQMQPVADLLQKFVSGAYAKPESGGAPGGERSLEDIQGELEKGVKGLYGGEFKGKDFEDFGTHGWWALGEGKSTYGDPDVLKRVREQFPDLVNQYSKAYKAKREARLKDLLGDNPE